MTNPSVAAPGYAPAADRSPPPAAPHGGAPPLALPRGGVDWLLVAAVVAVAAALVRALWFTPVEAMQGAAQKIFYVHVPSAFVGLYLGLPIVAIASGVYLWLKDERLDRTAEAAAHREVVEDGDGRHGYEMHGGHEGQVGERLSREERLAGHRRG